MNYFEKFRKNITSQYGEDGIIEELFRIIGEGKKSCIEFGAWDGKYLSNVWNLWHNKEWNALLIEGEKDRADQLKNSISNFKNVKVSNKFVRVTGEDTLDNIVKENKFEQNVDLLSIDIDSDDYGILNSLEYLKPRVIIIEYNPTVPPHLEIVQQNGEFFGASALSILKLANTKGYKLVAITDTNLILVNAADFTTNNLVELDLVKYFPGTHLTYIITGYNGFSYINHKPPYLYEVENLNNFINKISTFKTWLKKLLGKNIDPSPRKYPKIVGLEKGIKVRLFEE